MDLDWYIIWDYRADLLRGLWLTVRISLIAMVGATLVGVAVGCLRTLPGFLVRRLTGLYVEVLRNIPIVVKLFFAHFILGLDALPAGIVVLILHRSAYIADVTAAGLRSVPYGQTEAALASGLSTRQVFGWVLLPQALRAMIPPMTTQYTQVVKNSSVVMLIALQDLTFMTQRIEHETFRGVEAASTVTLLYLLIVLCVAAAMAGAQRLVDRRLA
ncbi:amino acid ABC transporter permease [Pelagibius litoralis]|uniref:Amino acid ABC transporter permease n=1 Tax=Pelagibius litoralis TaxID=374515 RepID=A0A967EZW6_9PROT|nr:amino acid ABC transporter permease [Pelagibius litoralis]NIA70444.1 amino acid ABC transporter permease [Pelagibius litoralis]